MNSQEKIWDKLYAEGKMRWRKETHTSFPPFKGKRVLELGAGNGKTLRALLQTGAKEIVAVDFSSEALRLSKELYSSKKLRFLKEDARKLPFAKGSFDVIVCYYLLNNLLEKDRVTAVHEMYRVLKKKGKLFFQDLAAGDFREQSTKTVESHTVERETGIICHFFTISEVGELYKQFSMRAVREIVTTPILHRPGLKRIIISGTFTK